jgi:uncharacterized protein (DUF427 family)
MKESVWDYPRPPHLESSPKKLKVVFNGVTIAESNSAYRVLETSHPPTYYFPPEDVKREHLLKAQGRSICEWKGQAAYFDVVVHGQRAPRAAWNYSAPTPDFEPIAGYICFYASKMDACFVDGEEVRAQAGDYYGGWVTGEIVGPFKGAAGTGFW